MNMLQNYSMRDSSANKKFHGRYFYSIDNKMFIKFKTAYFGIPLTRLSYLPLFQLVETLADEYTYVR